jgi:hypothetical protein
MLTPLMSKLCLGKALAPILAFGPLVQVPLAFMKRRVFALFGVVAVLLTATMSLTLSRVTLSAGVGSLKCYDKVGIEKAC